MGNKEKELEEVVKDGFLMHDFIEASPRLKELMQFCLDMVTIYPKILPNGFHVPFAKVVFLSSKNEPTDEYQLCLYRRHVNPIPTLTLCKANLLKFYGVAKDYIDLRGHTMKLPLNIKLLEIYFDVADNARENLVIHITKTIRNSNKLIKKDQANKEKKSYLRPVILSKFKTPHLYALLAKTFNTSYTKYDIKGLGQVYYTADEIRNEIKRREAVVSTTAE